MYFYCVKMDCRHPTITQKSCSVPTCTTTSGNDVLHRFPNPQDPNQIERFRVWIMRIGGDIIGLDDLFIYNNRRICHRHFETVYTFPNKRLTKLAIPTLHLAGVYEHLRSRSATTSMVVDEVQTSTSCLVPTPSITASMGIAKEQVVHSSQHTAENKDGKLPPEAKDTAKLLIFFDQLFDSVNGSYSKPRKGKIYRSAATQKSPHSKLWQKSLPILKTMKFIDKAGKRRVVPSISSWIKTIEGIQKLTKYFNDLGLNLLYCAISTRIPLKIFLG